MNESEVDLLEYAQNFQTLITGWFLVSNII